MSEVNFMSVGVLLVCIGVFSEIIIVTFFNPDLWNFIGYITNLGMLVFGIGLLIKMYPLCQKLGSILNGGLK